MVSHIFHFLSHRRRRRSYHSLPKKKKKRTSSLSSYLPDECWECIFKFININNDGKSLSLVSKQLLSITNRLRFSLCVRVETLPCLFKRFTNLTSLDLTHFHDDDKLDNLLTQISAFPLKLTSLKLPDRCRFPTYGLKVFSNKITTLTSLTCFDTIFGHDLPRIGVCFPLLVELNLQCPLVLSKHNKGDFIHSIRYLLSKSPCIQHLNLCRTSFLKDPHVVDFSLLLSNLVSVNLNLCNNLTQTTLFSLLRNCPLLSELRMEDTSISNEIGGHPGVCPRLKSLYLGRNGLFDNEMMILFASIFPNLQLLDLHHCHDISKGICQVLRKCCKLTHLNLAFGSEFKLHKLNFVVPELEVLNLSHTDVKDKALYAISKNCCGLLQLQLDNCKNVTEKGVQHVVENCKQLKKIFLGDFHISDKNRELFSSHGCLLC